jgi:hypothetical protein
MIAIATGGTDIATIIMAITIIAGGILGGIATGTTTITAGTITTTRVTGAGRLARRNAGWPFFLRSGVRLPRTRRDA